MQFLFHKLHHNPPESLNWPLWQFVNFSSVFSKTPISPAHIAFTSLWAISERLNMSSKIYVGNLPYSINDDNLRENFAAYGDVASAKVMMDRDSGRSKGFGFVEMGSSEQAEAAIQGLNGMSVGGRSIIVNISRPKEPSTGGGGGYRNDRGAY